MTSNLANARARASLPAVITFDRVPFEGTDILAGRQGDVIFVPMKSFCSSIGLPWEGMRKRIERDEVLRKGRVIMTVPSAGGGQRQMTLPLNLIPGFLLGAEASRYAPELQERVRTFRARCYDVLANHFFGPGAQAMTPVPDVLPAPAPPPRDQRAIANAVEIVERLRTEAPGPVRTFYQQLLEQTCANLGLDAPLVPTDPTRAPSPTRVIDALLVGLRTLDGRKVPYNHLGEDAHGRIALNLPELARLFAKHDIDVPIDDPLRAALDAGDHRYRTVLRSIESKIRHWRDRTVQCHVLERATGPRFSA